MKAAFQLANKANTVAEKTEIITDNDVLNEEAILKQSLTDSEAFKPIYEKYFKKIFLFLLHRTGEKETAADLAQQVFLKALTGLSKFQFRGLPFSAWLYRIAINECNTFFRKTKHTRWVTLDQRALEQLHEEITSDNQLHDLEVRLPAILQKLPERDIQLIELRFFEGRPFKEIAMILDISEISAKVRTYRLLDKLKSHFFKL
jgi:RNA polymerase sigma-70 factor, ECF subfamily